LVFSSLFVTNPRLSSVSVLILNCYTFGQASNKKKKTAYKHGDVKSIQLRYLHPLFLTRLPTSLLAPVAGVGQYQPTNRKQNSENATRNKNVEQKAGL